MERKGSDSRQRQDSSRRIETRQRARDNARLPGKQPVCRIQQRGDVPPECWREGGRGERAGPARTTNRHRNKGALGGWKRLGRADAPGRTLPLALQQSTLAERRSVVVNRGRWGGHGEALSLSFSCSCSSPLPPFRSQIRCGQRLVRAHVIPDFFGRAEALVVEHQGLLFPPACLSLSLSSLLPFHSPPLSPSLPLHPSPCSLKTMFLSARCYSFDSQAPENVTSASASPRPCQPGAFAPRDRPRLYRCPALRQQAPQPEGAPLWEVSKSSHKRRPSADWQMARRLSGDRRHGCGRGSRRQPC